MISNDLFPIWTIWVLFLKATHQIEKFNTNSFALREPLTLDIGKVCRIWPCCCLLQLRQKRLKQSHKSISVTVLEAPLLFQEVLPVKAGRAITDHLLHKVGAANPSKVVTIIFQQLFQPGTCSFKACVDAVVIVWHIPGAL